MVTPVRAGITSCQLVAEGSLTGVRISRKFLALVVGPNVEIFAVMRSVILDVLPPRQHHAKFSAVVRLASR